MACNGRVANKGAQLGLPELQLGELSKSRQWSTGSEVTGPTFIQNESASCRYHPWLRRHAEAAEAHRTGEGPRHDSPLQACKGALPTFEQVFEPL